MNIHIRSDEERRRCAQAEADLLNRRAETPEERDGA